MQISFSVRDNASRWAWTEGLGAARQSEIAVPLPWLDDRARDEQIVRLLRFIETYIRRQSRRILAGQTLTYGWTTLRFDKQEEPSASSGGGRLVLYELRDPFAAGETPYVAGVTRAIEILEIQQAALRRNRITGLADHPHRMHHAIVCAEVMRRNGSLTEPLVLERGDQSQPHDSGWVVRCASRTHNHDDSNELHQVHLLHVVTAFPITFAYLAMPIGTAVMTSDPQVIVFPPGHQAGEPDPDPQRTLPWSNGGGC